MAKVFNYKGDHSGLLSNTSCTLSTPSKTIQQAIKKVPNFIVEVGTPQKPWR